MKNGTCASISILKDELEELIAYMEHYLEIEYTKNKAMKKYASHLLKETPNLKKLAKQEKEKKIVIKVLKLFVKITNNGE